MKTQSQLLINHNALFRSDMTDWEFNVWLFEHTEIMNKKSLIGF